MIITIDGPSGTGKSTVAKELARRLGFTFFETGATYRSLSWLALKEGIDPTDQGAVEALLERFQYEIRMTEDGDRKYLVCGTDVTNKIRTQAISMAASQVATYPLVRKAMVAIQREYGSKADAVFEGRDMGTVVFPEADLKIFLTASPEVRTERRYRELMQKFPDLSMTREALLKETIARDTADATRAISPLKQASDAVLIDTSSLSVKQVIEKILQIGFKTKRPKMHLFYRVIYTLARAYFRLFYRLKVEGLHHFRPGSALIAANHSSFFDPPVLAVACPEEVHFFAKTTLFKIPFLSTLIKALNAHPVSSLRQGRRWLLDGEKIILFPEGTRSEGGQLLPLQEGVALLASKAKCRMIPAYIQGTSEVWPLSRTFPRFRGQISVYFGPAIEWDPSLDSAKMTAKLKQAILSLRPDKM